MRIILAPDSFKGSTSAVAVSCAMERGVLSVFPDAEVMKIPIADGGEGTVEAMVTAAGGQFFMEQIQDPLGRPHKAYWGILGDNQTAVIEMAAASGLPLVPMEKRDPRITTTYGTGQLIRAALDKDVKKIIIGIGGSATNDAGTGMLQSLGARFLDKNKKELPPGGAALINLNTIDLSALDSRLKTTEIIVACDVDNPLCGPRGASSVYGPQKGATEEMVVELDQALSHFAFVANQTTGKNVSTWPGAGAAGGLGAGFLYFTKAALCPGVETILEAANFSEKVAGANLVITGEGRTDYQTAFGKAPVGVAKKSKTYQVPVVCLAGSLGEGAEQVLHLGIDALFAVAPGPITLTECMKQSEQLIEEATIRMCLTLKIGMNMKSK